MVSDAAGSVLYGGAGFSIALPIFPVFLMVQLVRRVRRAACLIRDEWACCHGNRRGCHKHHTHQ